MLPVWLQEKIASPPEAGAGIHAWLFSCARQLHAHMPPEAIMAVLQAATAGAGRVVTVREIRDAVQNSHSIAWQPDGRKQRPAGLARKPYGETSQPTPERWPKRDAVTRECAIRNGARLGVGGLVDLWERSPVRPEMEADDWLDWLFPDAEWLCLAADHPATARTRRREKWSFGAADECGLVVPSPMTGPSGKGLDGKVTHRCLDNTGPRRWLVIEFDSGTIDEQAALHGHLADCARAMSWPSLTLALHSAGKSLHGWYGPVGNESMARQLMEYATLLGADPATWVPCQLVRLPGGCRKGKRLEVFFFNPHPCQHTITKTTPEPQLGCGNSSEQDTSRPERSMNAA